MAEQAYQLERFTPRADPAVIDDLRARLRATRWPDAAEGDGWSLGTDLAYLRELVAYWADEFDWDAQEDAIGRLPHYRAQLGGSSVHLVHARAADRSRPVLPLLLTHGWPDSFWRYLKVIPLLTDPGAHGGDPDDAFDVIVPDMPGYGYSERPTRPLTSPDVADRWSELMTLLGYDRFVTAGGDIGSGVSRFLALDHPDRVIAVHRMDAGLPFFAGDRSELTQDERDWLDDAATWAGAEGAYAAMHRTKPQTAAFGLIDSPVGLAAWLVEKLRSWSDCDGDVERCFTKDEILTLLTQYWVNGNIGSAMRMYHSNASISAEQLSRRVEVPSGFSIFPADIVRPPRAWLERMTNLARATEPDRGGHFAPFEQPELYVQELREFFRPYRSALSS
ncbi:MULTISPECIES: epoxide hydrolase [unclassified Microbacterium]|uniref:epoxide hydrolase family protein n=1 Tax=unclassified Microbacterium TaxID=2609290 RepID=UPI00214B2B55|nr:MULTISPECIES: epoxide hydrolase [unclassified Microbacterium]MCR2810592.1 epoxide hydrolase 1 [Microbacterium sp. zg.B185]WIM18130.1 epoxide hydrolase [Microbacterium sp. zg-B185]